MSSTKRGFSPTVPAGMESKKPPPPHTNNGSGPPPLKYSSEPVDDVNMNEVIDGKIELEVILPGGKTTQLTVDSNVPMQDLRVLLAAKSKVSPTGYILSVFSDETGKPLDYKANQTIGSLEGRTVQLQSKSKEKEVEKRMMKKDSSKNLQPFETTHRFTVNLPHNQKMVTRISPETNLGQLYAHVCKEKHLDPKRFTFQHPTNHHVNLDLRIITVGDLKSNEINLIPLGLVADSARSMPDLSRSESLTLPKESFPSYMPGASEPKKKRGFLSFLKRKDNKFKLHETRYQDMETSSTTSNQMSVARARQNTTPPPERRESDAANLQVRPKSMFVTAKELKVHDGASYSQGKENTLPQKAATKKKRPAPPPPQQQKHAAPETVEISVKDKTSVVMHEKREGVSKVTPDHVTQRLHSRNSSDSSGYHELTLSGAESPEANRVSTNFKTSIDTTSIESADNTNGDSGINEHSPVHSSPKYTERAAGDSQTLPHNRLVKKQVQRSHSLERKEMSNKAPPPSTKKKRAPAPPPVAEPPPPSPSTPPSHTPEASQDHTLSTSPPEAKQTTKETSSGNDDETDGKMDTDDDDSEDINETLDGLLMMVEDDSICSEDIENIEQPKVPRPCSFVAPPPPSEPPPPTTGPTETVDVGVEVHDNASLGPSSAKSSPVAVHTHSRTDSLSSISSINTIEDVNLAFEQTIALAEEVLEAEAPAESGYKSEMAIFVERMSKLTEKADSESNMSDTTSISLPDTESNSETGSVIRHDQDGRPFHAKMDSYSSDSGSVQKYDSEDRSHGGSATDASSYDDVPVTNAQQSRSRRDSLEIHRENIVADNEVSEIDVPMEMVPPPIEFRNDPQEEGAREEEMQEEEEEEEEEYRESTEEIIITIAPSSGFTFAGANKIPDLETPKEHSSLPDSPRFCVAEPSLSYSRMETDPNSTNFSEPKPQTDVKPPRVKEEFVLTREDLSKIKYVEESKWRSEPYVQPARRPTSLSSLTQVYRDEQEPAVSYASFQPSYSKPESIQGSRSEEDNVKTRCSELSFRPDSEGEIDNVLEEKSISMIALPAMRTSVLKKSDEEYLTTLKQESYQSLVQDTMSSGDREMRSKFFDDDEEDAETEILEQLGKVYISERSEDKGTVEEENKEITKQQAALQSQYAILQQQFSMWQQQLKQNQDLLANQHIDPEVQSMQEIQIQQMQQQMQIQQQMMSQLEKSMEVLALQKKPKSEQPSAVASESASVVVASSERSGQGAGRSSVPTPPPPPPVTVVKKTANSGRVNKKDDPRFQRKLDPREELMIAIRSFGGRGKLSTVPIQNTHWQGGSS
ncbi:protein piccolo-like isoform X3 [Haliotis rufescens]|nr:protein piccolo-like isoform X3 [Haliotis rufescens]XP_048242697.1 protein piccolo-like isoform X3 [Haliotis rufescens]XP_048242698.1 protein piccolo-like isoform X3 [Haliotis rufescens]